jgi:hypothetical protein
MLWSDTTVNEMALSPRQYLRKSYAVHSIHHTMAQRHTKGSRQVQVHNRQQRLHRVARPYLHAAVERATRRFVVVEEVAAVKYKVDVTRRRLAQYLLERIERVATSDRISLLEAQMRVGRHHNAKRVGISTHAQSW